jgi:hypothetical protein
MSLLNCIKKTEGCIDTDGTARGWIIYFKDNDDIREVKCLFKPNEYKGVREVYNDAQIIDKLSKYQKLKRDGEKLNLPLNEVFIF